MNFSEASKVGEVISQMKQAELLRSPNRALIDNLFNGIPPYTAQEEKENQIYVNVNFKEGTNALHAARGQYENAFLKPGNFFKVTLDSAPVDKQAEWSRIVTKEINTSMKMSRPYLQTQRSKFAGVCLHGVGCEMWEDDENPIPFNVSMSDLLIPTDTDLTLENMPYFAVRRKMRPGLLFKKTIAKGENMDQGWNLKVVKKLLESKRGENISSGNENWTNSPEKMAELYKQNLSYYNSDKAPEFLLWDFYWNEEGEEGGREAGWYRAIILDDDCVAESYNATEDGKPDFVYFSEKPYAEKLDEFIHFQFGDGNNVPPFKYHSIRSLGWLLYDVIQLMNRLRCQFTQHVFEQMLTLMRLQEPSDRARVMKVIMSNLGVLPDGVNLVPASERYSVDKDMVGSLMANMKQLINESSSSYTQAIDTGTQKERTKFEVEAIMSQISSLMSSMLNLAYIQEFFAYFEICRRFTNKDSENFMVKKFMNRCKSQGVPESMLNVENWTIAVEQVLGSGNKMLEIAQARELRSMRPTLDPEAQREVDRIYIGALTDNAKLADFLVPEGGEVTDAMHDAELAFGTLMQGVPMSLKEGLNHHEQITTLLKLMGITIKQIQSGGAMATQQQITGLNTVAQYIDQHIQVLAQDQNERQKVKEYSDILSNFMNFVRAFEQRLQQASQQNQNQGDPAEMQKLEAAKAMAQIKIGGKAAQDQQKLTHKQQAFEQDQQLKVIASETDNQIKQYQGMLDTALKAMQAAAAPKQPTESPEPVSA